MPRWSTYPHGLKSLCCHDGTGYWLVIWTGWISPRLWSGLKREPAATIRRYGTEAAWLSTQTIAMVLRSPRPCCARRWGASPTSGTSPPTPARAVTPTRPRSGMRPTRRPPTRASLPPARDNPCARSRSATGTSRAPCAATAACGAGAPTSTGSSATGPPWRGRPPCRCAASAARPSSVRSLAHAAAIPCKYNSLLNQHYAQW